MLESVKLSIFDRDFQKLPVHRVGYDEYIKARRPEIYSDMLRVAEVLSEDFPMFELICIVKMTQFILEN